MGVIGTVLGSIGTAGVLGGRNGGLTNWLSGNQGNDCSENTPVSRYELQQESRIAKLESDLALKDANTYNDQKSLELYKYIDGEIKDIRATMCANDKAQAVINAKFESGFDVLSSQVSSISATISGLTKTVIPNANVCPGWGNVCVEPTGCSTVCGYNSNI